VGAAAAVFVCGWLLQPGREAKPADPAHALRR
jgi:hypothetical protein